MKSHLPGKYIVLTALTYSNLDYVVQYLGEREEGRVSREGCSRQVPRTGKLIFIT